MQKAEGHGVCSQVCLLGMVLPGAAQGRRGWLKASGWRADSGRGRGRTAQGTRQVVPLSVDRLGGTQGAGRLSREGRGWWEWQSPGEGSSCGVQLALAGETVPGGRAMRLKGQGFLARQRPGCVWEGVPPSLGCVCVCVCVCTPAFPSLCWLFIFCLTPIVFSSRP